MVAKTYKNFWAIILHYEREWHTMLLLLMPYFLCFLRVALRHLFSDYMACFNFILFIHIFRCSYILCVCITWRWCVHKSNNNMKKQNVCIEQWLLSLLLLCFVVDHDGIIEEAQGRQRIKEKLILLQGIKGLWNYFKLALLRDKGTFWILIKEFFDFGSLKLQKS